MSLKKIVFISTILLFTSALVIFSFNNKKNYQPNIYYQVYLDNNLLGTISSYKELNNYINNAQKSLIDLYNITEVLEPEGLEIKKVVTFEERLASVEYIYNEIEKIKPFTVEGYQIVLEADSENKKIYVINEDVFKDAVEIAISTFVGKEKYENYKNGNQIAIEDVGAYINQVYVDNEMTIQKTNIATTEKIYTDSSELAKYLLYGTTAKHKKYISNIGDTLEQIAFKNEISVEELLLNNPQFKNINHLLYPGLEIIISALNPQIKVTVEQEVVEDMEDSYNVIERVDETLNIGITKVIRNGENGVVRAKQMVKTVNGTDVYVQQISKEQLKQPIDKIIVIGGKKVSGVGGNTWQWPTESGWRITSGYAYRINPITGKRELHGALDIAGTGYGSNIYAANAGIIYKIGEDDVNGRHIIINHQNGYYTMYNHLSSYGQILTGMAIEKGYVIGYMGMTGQATGPHLHFAVWYGGAPGYGSRINPWKLYS